MGSYKHIHCISVTASTVCVLAGNSGLVEIKEALQSTGSSAEDKLRLCILFLLVTEKLPSEGETNEIQESLQAAGSEVEAFQYVLRMRQMNLTGATMSGPARTTANKSSGSLLGLVDSSIVSGIAGQFGKQLTKLVGGTRQVWRARDLFI